MKGYRFLFILIVLPLISCQDEFKINKDLEGYAQKGPFAVGGRITIEELNKNFSPKGIIYETITEDDFGRYVLPEGISSKFLKLSAEGFYFDENRGRKSSFPILLRSISNLGDQEGTNINILTTLAHQRILHLIQTEGMGFSEASNKAKKEILKIFNVTNSEIEDFENLNINKIGDGNAFLLAASTVVSKDNYSSDLSEVINAIAFDIKEDGVLDDPALKNELFDNAVKVKVEEVRQNMQNFYSEESSMSNFELYTKRLIDPEFYDLPVDLSSNLVFHFNPNGGQPDLSGNGSTIKFDGVTLTENRKGASESAYLVSRQANSFIELPSDLDLWIPGWTYSVWVIFNGMDDWGEAVLFGNRQKYDYFQDVYFLINSLQKSGDGENFASTSIFTDEGFKHSHNYINQNMWYQFTLTYKEDEIYLYINGELSQVARSNFSLEHPLGSPYEVVQARGSSRKFDGAISDIRFYRRALNLAECKALYEADIN
ncbi:MAG: LamG-like jellyroll fold domain-containing protein [Cyclobacteriaceae bacterium]